MDPDTVIQQIEDVEIQGATAVARTGVELLQDLAEKGADRDDIETTADRLKAARPTEPFLRNAVNVALETEDYADVLAHIDTARDDITPVAAELVESGDTVFTHCHSSTVTASLVHAHDDGASFAVHCTETRPLYQGRTTAKELAEAGIPVELYVDAGARLALKKADVMLIGADAITSTGKVVNKIGSELFAEVAHGYDIPVYIVTDSWKFDSRSRFGYHESLERRVADEVWPDAPGGVDVMNYAFEHVHPDLIDGIVSELGVLAPDSFVQAVMDTYPELQGNS